jgi:hypothetical protein
MSISSTARLQPPAHWQPPIRENDEGDHAAMMIRIHAVIMGRTQGTAVNAAAMLSTTSRFLPSLKLGTHSMIFIFYFLSLLFQKRSKTCGLLASLIVTSPFFNYDSCLAHSNPSFFGVIITGRK